MEDREKYEFSIDVLIGNMQEYIGSSRRYTGLTNYQGEEIYEQCSNSKLINSSTL